MVVHLLAKFGRVLDDMPFHKKQTIPEFVTRTYRNREEIDKGASGTIFKAISPIHGSEVALKVILVQHKRKKNPSFSWSKRGLKIKDNYETIPGVERKKVKNELQVWKRINHASPFLVELYDYLDFQSEVWFVMPLYNTLANFLSDFEYEHQAYLPMSVIKEFYAGILLALRALNEFGVIHRDVKVENILITNDLVVKLADFGLCEFTHTPDGRRKHLVSKKGSFGTWYIAPPEAYILGSEYNESADMYSFCICMLTSKYVTPVWKIGEDCDINKNLLRGSVYETCYEKLTSGKWSLEEAEEFYWRLARMIPQDHSLGGALLYDPHPWPTNRFEFSEFAKLCMKWKIEERLTAAGACDHPFMKESVKRWNKNVRMGMKYVRGLIDTFLGLEQVERHKVF
mmetsp:Transcript_7742/g.8881  ORF Transcript_7742/g.8881 Transcript_7742/m.8881 type:complete len:399 (+) Transcript_7742:72-1268(+)